jgi:hypothetical protein
MVALPDLSCTEDAPPLASYWNQSLNTRPAVRPSADQWPHLQKRGPVFAKLTPGETYPMRLLPFLENTTLLSGCLTNRRDGGCSWYVWPRINLRLSAKGASGSTGIVAGAPLLLERLNTFLATFDE